MPDARSVRPDAAPFPLPEPEVCLGRTCLAWERDGELSQTDVHLILERLCLVDSQACEALRDAG